MENEDIKIFTGETLPESRNKKDLVSQEKKKEIHTFFTSPVCMNQLRKSLPRVGVTADRIIRLLFSAIAEVPKLAECSPKSLFNVMIQCAQVGLEPNTALGHAYIIPYGCVAKLIIGYRGLLELCRRSKEFAHVYAHEVYPDDSFDIGLGTESYIKHKPSYTVEYDEQDILGCYAIAKFKDGSYMFEYMPKFEIDKIRKRSIAGNSGPWVSDFMMMARKTVIRRLMHYLPLTIEMAEAIKTDGENEVGIESMNSIIDNVIDEQKEEVKKQGIKKQSNKKEEKKQPVKSEEKPKAQSHKQKSKETEFQLLLKSFDVRNITETEILAYFGIENIEDLDCEQGINDLKKITSDIEGEKITVEEFKKAAAERFEMRQKENKKPLL